MMIPPHEHRHLQGFESKFGFRLKSLLSGMAISTIFAMSAGIVLHTIKMPLTVILPTLAPIWIGIMTIAYMMQTQ